LRFVADENVDKPLVERLRKDGHIVLSVVEMEPGISDDEVIQRANQDSALLLTADKDFGDWVFRQDRIVHGCILVRLAGLSPQRKAEVVATSLQERADELAQNFTVITPGGVRIRKRYSSNT